MQELFSVRDKVVHVSGGSRGIGLAIARAFHEAGARVVVSARNRDTLAATGLEYEVCDIRDSGQIRRCVERILERHGRIDVLFNVAGINYRHAAETYPEEKLDELLAINLRGNYLMAQACGRAMIAEGRGKIINVASLHTHFSLAGMAPYGATKGAIAAMTRALAVEWARHNIQVNAIAPGFIRTDLNRMLWEQEAIRQWVVERVPAGRVGAPEDVIGVALFLASAASDYMTGQVLYVDGGLTAGQTWPLTVPR
ncbi:MAG: SDR family oxidoreductase [Bryobacterales bacterium]|nr:SDR family oxidoreductase [Bryobacteraceae bacterium]MDW8129025.1 SDR family oxidoreductase [Bryobacterales bacterium]